MMKQRPKFREALKATGTKKDVVTLRIALLKPDYENLAIKDIPFTLTSAELNLLLNKNGSH